MTLLLGSLLAGIFTVAAPCVLPLLPVVLGRSLTPIEGGQTPPRHRAWVIAGALGLSIILFTLLLKATTALLGVPTMVWQTVSGVIIIAFGVQLLFPGLWDQISSRLKLQARSARFLQASNPTESSWKGDALLGLALGPVFNSCSPTYALLVAAILPASFGLGVAALAAYALGLAGTLLALSLFGQWLVRPLKVASNPHGWFRRGLGFLLVLTGLTILLGFDKALQTFILEQGWYDAIADFERATIDQIM